MSAVSAVPPPFHLQRSLGDTPVGAVVAYAGSSAGVSVEAWGWMLCDGRALAARIYPELFAVLGYQYGGADDTFQLPDYRGCFLRGHDGGAGGDIALGESTDPLAPGTRAKSIDVSYLIKFTFGMRV